MKKAVVTVLGQDNVHILRTIKLTSLIFPRPLLGDILIW